MEEAPSPEALALIQAREASRKNRDWAAADRIRDQLRSMGVEVRDAPIKEK